MPTIDRMENNEIKNDFLKYFKNIYYILYIIINIINLKNNVTQVFGSNRINFK
jgi:hypothetical protein